MFNLTLPCHQSLPLNVLPIPCEVSKPLEPMLPAVGTRPLARLVGEACLPLVPLVVAAVG